MLQLTAARCMFGSISDTWQHPRAAAGAELHTGLCALRFPLPSAIVTPFQMPKSNFQPVGTHFLPLQPPLLQAEALWCILLAIQGPFPSSGHRRPLPDPSRPGRSGCQRCSHCRSGPGSALGFIYPLAIPHLPFALSACRCTVSLFPEPSPGSSS